VDIRLLPFFVLLSLATESAAALPNLLTIDWQRLPDLLHTDQLGSSGFQNSDGGWITEDSIVTAFGHGRGSWEPKVVSEFLNQTYLLNVTAALATPCRGRGTGCEHALWARLPDAPVSGRQDVASTTINGVLYILGGFSYSAPYVYSDFLQLAPLKAGGWKWSRLPAFPYALSMHAVASLGSKVYVQGGACYDRLHFVNFFDCRGGTAGLGKRLYVYDTADPSAKWERLPDNPGPPRANAALSSLNGSLYLIGGMSFVPTTANKTAARTLIDNWRYDTTKSKWTRLVDLPIASGNFQTNGPQSSFLDRYIILIGGYQYGETYFPNGTTGPSFGLAQRLCPAHTPAGPKSVGCLPHCPVQMPNVTYMGRGTWSHEYNNDVFVYDTVDDVFGRALGTSGNDPGLILPNCGAFPINDNLPQVNVLGDRIFALGGECNDIVIDGAAYGHYPPLALSGKIKSLQ
jgi:hypothetical protein